MQVLRGALTNKDVFKRIIRSVIDLLSQLRSMSTYARILEARSIARRMFITNSFDGLLSSLGVILGSYLSGATNPANYIGGVAGASFAMGFFSGFIATYMSERAERLRELRETEKAVLHSLKGSIYERAARVVPLYVAIWSGFGAIILPLIGILPFIISAVLGFGARISLLVYASAAIIIGELFALGAYLGHISGENPIISGLRLALIGLGAVIFFAFIGAVV
ncbi:hypothetical protein PYJP_09310 [Pyrofollis japonicus]|nr:hypothetical protein PYJP_09310 [Pyrofollis japonicus]